MRANGAQVFVVNPKTKHIIKAECPEGISIGGKTIEVVEKDCIEMVNTIKRPGKHSYDDSSFTAEFKEAKGDYLALNTLGNSGEEGLKVVYAFPDGVHNGEIDKEHPFYDGADLTFPDTRSYLELTGFFSSCKLEGFESGAEIKLNLTLVVNDLVSHWKVSDDSSGSGGGDESNSSNSSESDSSEDNSVEEES